MTRRRTMMFVAVCLALGCCVSACREKHQPVAAAIQPPTGTKILERIGQGYVAAERVKLAPPATNLTATARLENFNILWTAIDRYYSFFDLKKIDWNALRETYRSKAAAVKSDREFYELLDALLRELRDAHAYLDNYKDPRALPDSSPPLGVRLVEGQAVVVGDDLDDQRAGPPPPQMPPPGSVLLTVDGVPTAEAVAALRLRLPPFSSERGFLFTAYRKVLYGQGESTVRVQFRPPNDQPVQEMAWRRSSLMNAWRPAVGFPLTAAKFIHHGRHPAGVGYLRIVNFWSTDLIVIEFKEALEKLQDAPALIIDLRDNPGGRGITHNQMIGRLINEPRLAAIDYDKIGPGRRDFRRRPINFKPTGGKNPYLKPIALLLNGETGSAADLFACYLTSVRPVLTVGSTTHGDLSGHAVFAVLPCGLQARIPDRYITDAAGRIIEVNGIEPQIKIEPTIADVAQGVDTVLERAVVELKKVIEQEKN